MNVPELIYYSTLRSVVEVKQPVPYSNRASKLCLSSKVDLPIALPLEASLYKFSDVQFVAFVFAFSLLLASCRCFANIYTVKHSGGLYK
jgi:hypothetical protein